MFTKFQKLLSLTLAFLILLSSQQVIFGKTFQSKTTAYPGEEVAIVTPNEASESNQSSGTSKEAAELYSLSGVTFDGTQSGWAEPELEAAYNYGLTYPGVMNNFKKLITREEFCIIAVKLYEKLSGKTAVAGTDPFTDTSNPEILKAYNLKIVNGISADKFQPAANIIREQICVMIYRAIDAAIPSLDMSAEIALPFSDVKKIDSWALAQMKFAFKHEIMKGYSATEIAPLENTSREQAIAMLLRTYLKFSAAPDISTPPDIATIPVKNAPAQKENVLKSYAWMREGSAFIPKFDQRIELYASTMPGKPTLKPVSPRTIANVSETENNNGLKLFAYNGNTIFEEDFFQYSALSLTLPTLPITPALPDLHILPEVKSAPSGPYYTSANFGAFIDQSGDRKRWFAYKLKNAAGAAKVVWQVSTAPYSGKADNWKSPAGLVASGEVAASAGEFLIDFGNLKNSAFSMITLTLSSYNPIPQAQKTYYVRSVPVNSWGAPIGDPGPGIGVIYGKRAQNVLPAVKSVSTCELWSTQRTYLGSYSGEFQDRPAKYSEVGVSPKDSDTSRLFHFHNLDADITQIAIQVSENPFTGNEPWPSDKKLLYEKSYTVPVATTGLPSYFPTSEYPSSVLVPFSEFGKPAAEMEAEKYVKYYVRGVLLTPAQTPGTVDVSYTSTVTVTYGFGEEIVWYSPPAPKYEYINRSLPSLKIKSYEPVKWAASDYLQHYYIYRQPTADDVKSCWKNSETGEILYPYDKFFGEPYYKAQGITSKTQYEQVVIPRVLKTGYKVYFAPPQPEDEEWYEELYNGIVEFFEDLVHIASEIVNQVSSAYNGLKSGLINYVAELCPIPALKGAFKTALEGLVNYGLIAVGLPPTLPNFKDLSSMSLDYLAEVALTEAGIPENDLTKYAVDEIKDSIAEEIKKASNYADTNPVSAAFLKLDPDYSYRPAYVDVEMSNNSPYSTVAGSFNMDVTFEFDYYNMFYNNYDPDDGISFNSDNPYIAGSSAAITTSSAYMSHFLYGLNGNTVDFKNGDTAIYDVFNPIRGQKVPVLKPYETTTVRIYLSPYGFCGGANFARYPTGENLHPNDFDNMYFGNGNRKFNHFYLSGTFPTALEFMNSNGKTYLVTDPEVILTYKHAGPTSDTAKEKPVLSRWNK